MSAARATQAGGPAFKAGDVTTTVVSGGTVVTAAERFVADLYIRDGVIIASGTISTSPSTP